MGETMPGFTGVGSAVSAVLLAVLAVFVLFGALKGLTRGIQRQVIRTATIIASIVIALIAAKSVSSSVISAFDGMTTEEIVSELVASGVITSTEGFEWITNFDTETFKYIIAIPVALIAVPFIFVGVFMLASLVLYIVHGILCGVLGFRKKELNAPKRLLGLALGAVQGILVTAVVLVPVLGIARVASDSFETLRENENKSESEVEIIELYDENLKSSLDGPVVNVLNIFGGNLMYDILTSAKLDGENIKMSEQVAPVLSVYVEYSSNLADADFTALTEENKAAIKRIIAEIDDSEYFSPLLSGIMRGVSLTVAESEIVTEMEEPVKTLFATILDVFSSSDKTNIGTDLNTFCDLYFLLSDTGILKSLTAGDEGAETQPDILTLLGTKDSEGKTALARAINILNSNDRTKPIVSTLTKLSIAMLGEAMSPEMQEGMEQVYDGVKDGLTQVVQVKKEDYATEEEYKGAVSDTLENVLIDNNILTDSFVEENREEVDEVLSAVTDHIVENYGDLDEVGDEQITEIIVEYYDAYINGSLGDLIGGTVPAP